jgi:hypothetical protein
MSTGVWEPSKSVDINLGKLKELAMLVRSINLENLTAALPPETIESEKKLMHCQQKDWSAADGLDDGELICLIRFFTVAEMQLAGWDGGQLSPVIYLVRILKQRSAFDSELRRWIKANTDNRYLPNGAVL